MMEKKEITQLPTVDPSGRLAGVIHLHDILKSKLV
jgi:CBS domain-containing protein